MNAFKLDVPTKRGVILNGVLFRSMDTKADCVLIAITGIHGNFYSNPFYYNIGETLSNAGIDFIYAQTNDAFNRIRTFNVNTNAQEIIGSWNEDFNYTDEDIEAYLTFTDMEGYRNIILAGHSLGANKVIYYLSRHHDLNRVSKFLLLSPANLTWLTKNVTEHEKNIITSYICNGDGKKLLPFEFLGWIPCIASTAYQWLYTEILNNVHVEPDGNFSQVSGIIHEGALLIGTYDNFTYGDPAGFLANINDHMQKRSENKLIFIQNTGHTYQRKEQEAADKILSLIREWECDIYR